MGFLVDDEDIEAIMAEIPGGENFGRVRRQGRWAPLSPNEQDAILGDLWIDGDEMAYTRPRRPLETVQHGTLSTYNNDRCRCDECRAAMARYKQRARKRNVQSTTNRNVGFGGTPRPETPHQSNSMQSSWEPPYET